jgi:hypothetical protein
VITIGNVVLLRKKEYQRNKYENTFNPDLLCIVDLKWYKRILNYHHDLAVTCIKGPIMYKI